jgi:hypothetical protein
VVFERERKYSGMAKGWNFPELDEKTVAEGKKFLAKESIVWQFCQYIQHNLY